MRIAIELTSILLVGWIAGAEVGSWCCVQPVVARLPYEQDVAAEQGMLRTFGRINAVDAPERRPDDRPDHRVSRGAENRALASPRCGPLHRRNGIHHPDG